MSLFDASEQELGRGWALDAAIKAVEAYRDAVLDHYPNNHERLNGIEEVRVALTKQLDELEESLGVTSIDAGA